MYWKWDVVGNSKYENEFIRYRGNDESECGQYRIKSTVKCTHML